MTVASPQQDNPKDASHPDEVRMTIGEHLEELRKRLIRGLLGFVVALVFCLIYGRQIMAEFCAPFMRTLADRGYNPQMFYSEMSDPFTIYMRVSVICALAVALPWLFYQLWQFIAAGLYPHERKTVTRYIPLSLLLLVSGMLLVYFLVLPWSIQFFIDFGTSIRMPQGNVGTVPHPAVLPTVPILGGDPHGPHEGELWVSGGRLKMFYDNQVRVLPFGPENLAAPMITLSSYIDMVIMLLLTFGLSFQLPIVVMALVRVGLVDVMWLRKGRKYVYFALAILAAAMSPGDMVTAMLALMAPLILLYELGIFLSQWKQKPAEAAA